MSKLRILTELPRPFIAVSTIDMAPTNGVRMVVWSLIVTTVEYRLAGMRSQQRPLTTIDILAV
jgi:hypothetical protein